MWPESVASWGSRPLHFSLAHTHLALPQVMDSPEFCACGAHHKHSVLTGKQRTIDAHIDTSALFTWMLSCLIKFHLQNTKWKTKLSRNALSQMLLSSTGPFWVCGQTVIGLGSWENRWNRTMTLPKEISLWKSPNLLDFLLQFLSRTSDNFVYIFS